MIIRHEHHVYLHSDEVAERFQTKVLNLLGVVSAKIDRLVPPPGAEPIDTGPLEAATAKGEAATANLDATVKENQP